METVRIVDDVWGEDGSPDERSPNLDEELRLAAVDVWNGDEQRALLRIEYVAQRLRERI